VEDLAAGVKCMVLEVDIDARAGSRRVEYM
jgi:hypothetical protein